MANCLHSFTAPNSNMDGPSEEQQKAEKEQRREVRQKYKNIANAIDASSSDLIDVRNPRFEELRQETNAVNQDVLHTREQCSDTHVVSKLVNVLVTQQRDITDGAHKFDFTGLTCSLESSFKRHGDFSWVHFGSSMSCWLKTAPPVNTMLGPLAKEVKLRKQPAKKAAREYFDEVVPEELEYDEDDADEATNKRLQYLHDVVRTVSAVESSSSSQTKEFDLMKMLIDPTDPVQSIENFFDFAFLIKDKFVSLDLDSKTQLPVGKSNVAEADAEEGPEKQTRKGQMVLAISMKELREVSRLFKEQEEDASLQGDDARYYGTQLGYSQILRESHHSPSRETASHSSSSQSKCGTSHPLHRADRVYAVASAQEQSQILIEEAREKAERHKMMRKGTKTTEPAATQPPVAKAIVPAQLQPSVRSSNDTSSKAASTATASQPPPMRIVSPPPPPKQLVAASTAVASQPPPMRMVSSHPPPKQPVAKAVSKPAAPVNVPVTKPSASNATETRPAASKKDTIVEAAKATAAATSSGALSSTSSSSATQEAPAASASKVAMAPIFDPAKVKQSPSSVTVDMTQDDDNDVPSAAAPSATAASASAAKQSVTSNFFGQPTTTEKHAASQSARNTSAPRVLHEEVLPNGKKRELIAIDDSDEDDLLPIQPNPPPKQSSQISVVSLSSSSSAGASAASAGAGNIFQRMMSNSRAMGNTPSVSSTAQQPKKKSKIEGASEGKENLTFSQ